MTTKIKKSIGEAGAGIDQSHGEDTLYDAIKALATDLQAVIVSLNQLRTDYNAEDQADHTDTSAAAVTQTFTIE